MTSLAFLIVLTLALVGSGWTVLSCADAEGRIYGGVRWLAAFAVGSLLLYFAVFFSGLFIFSDASAAAILFSLLLIAIPSFRQMLGELRRCLIPAGRALLDWRVLCLWGVIAVSMVAMFVQALAPPNDYDSLNYHLAIPRNDIEQGIVSPHWYKGVFSFFPALAEHQVRIALALAGTGAAQGTTWLFGVFLILGLALLLRRAGSSPTVVALAVLMLISVRAIVWEMATCYVEIQLAVFVLLAYIAYDEWRRGHGHPWGALFAIAIAGGVLVKYHGLVVPFCFLPMIAWDFYKGRLRIRWLLAVAGLSALLLLPHMIRNTVYTGNPLFPIMNGLFNPGAPTFFSVDDDLYGRTRTALNYVRALWDISIVPTLYFDGAMLGAPYLLAFAPFAFWGKREKLAPMAIVMLAYLAFWHWGMTRQVRFLIPVLPFFAALAAVGASVIWQSRERWLKLVVMSVAAILAMNQLLFVGIYALIRVPPAVGLVSADDYHAKTPTMNGAYFGACRFIETRLSEGETFLSLLEPHSYYCPQSAAIVAPAFPEEARYWLTGAELPELTADELANELEKRRVAFVALETSREFRSGPASAPTVVDSDYSTNRMSRMGALIQPAVQSLQPLYRDGNSAVYDGIQVARNLRMRSLVPTTTTVGSKNDTSFNAIGDAGKLRP